MAARHAELAKKKRLLSREAVLQKEIKAREGSEQTIKELVKVEQEKEEILKLKEQEMRSTEAVVETLEYKLAVATSEAAKWTDNAFQVVQFVMQRSEDTISYEDFERQFPYIKTISNADVS